MSSAPSAHFWNFPPKARRSTGNFHADNRPEEDIQIRELTKSSLVIITNHTSTPSEALTETHIIPENKWVLHTTAQELPVVSVTARCVTAIITARMTSVPLSVTRVARWWKGPSRPHRVITVEGSYSWIYITMKSTVLYAMR